MNNDKSLIWKETKRKQLLKTVVMTVMETTSISPEGTEGNYIVMDARDWAIVIPVIEDTFLMVQQWRHGERALSMEFPGGVIEKDETPAYAAARELKEETGFTAENLFELGTMNPNPALMTNHVHIFLAENLVKSGTQSLDADEYVHFYQIPKTEVYKNIGTPAYPHALMCAALMLYKNHEDRI